MAAGAVRQDMPPRGGYPEIKYTRAIPRQRFSGLTVMLGGVAMMTAGFAVVIKSNREKRKDIKDQLRTRLYLLPLLQAEQDRRVIRAMKAFEEEEAQIMKDVPGWEVGKSVYHTSKWIPPHPALLKDFEMPDIDPEL